MPTGPQGQRRPAVAIDGVIIFAKRATGEIATKASAGRWK